MKRLTLLFAFLTCTIILTNAQEKLDDLLPVRGLELAAPAKDDFDAFVKFINDELDPLKVNTLLMRIDWNYQYKSRPELQGENPLTKSDIKNCESLQGGRYSYNFTDFEEINPYTSKKLFFYNLNGQDILNLNSR